MPEIAVLSCDLQQQRVCGIRLRQRGRSACELLGCRSSDLGDWVQAANDVLKQLAVNSSVYLILCISLDGSEVFECVLPEAADEVMQEALRFELPRYLLNVPENIQLQYTTEKSDSTSGMQRVRCAVVPAESLHKLYGQLARLSRKVDAVIHPLLTLPWLLHAQSVQLSGFEAGYCWCNGSWQLMGKKNAGECNRAVDEYIRSVYGSSYDVLGTAALDAALRTACLGGFFALQQFRNGSRRQAALNLLPDYLRPARYRKHLRLMALLVLLLVAVNVCRYAGSFWEQYRINRRQIAEVNNLRSKVQELRRAVKSGEKELKEIQRTAELKLGSRECLSYLGYLSDKLPDDVLLSNFRWNEGSVDLNLQTTSEELDLVSFFNRLPGFKVQSASQRSNPNNNLTVANVKLSVIESTPVFELGSRNKRKKNQ